MIPKPRALFPDGIKTLEQLKKLYLPTSTDFVFVDVPEMQFVMIDGAGSPRWQAAQGFTEMVVFDDLIR